MSGEGSTVIVHEQRLLRLESDVGEIKGTLKDLDKHLRNGLSTKVHTTADRVSLLLWFGSVVFLAVLGLLVDLVKRGFGV